MIFFNAFTFNDGEAVSAKIVCQLIESAGADEFITFNIHEECVLNFFDIPARNISESEKGLWWSCKSPVAFFPFSVAQ